MSTSITETNRNIETMIKSHLHVKSGPWAILSYWLCIIVEDKSHCIHLYTNGGLILGITFKIELAML